MRDPLKEARLLREIQKAQGEAVSTVRGLYRAKDDPRRNPDADCNWQDCSMRTRAALILTQGALAAERAKQQAAVPKVFGMVLIQQRVEDPRAWEQMAADVAEGKVLEALPVEKGTDG